MYSLGCVNLSYILFKNHYTELPPDRDQLILLNIYGIFFLVPVLSIQFGLLFLQKWKKTSVEKEKIQKEQIQTELLALKSHISPHFLFNNLNILSSLIEPSNHEAQEYLERFAEVYRYVLNTRKVELINLKEELKFMDSYRFLLLRRFPKELRFKMNISVDYQNFLLPPLSLQMIVENAIKHNKLSEHNPL